MPSGTTWPSDNGAERWQQRSTSAAGRPPASRNSTTGSLQMRRASGLSVSSSAQAAMYQALRTNIVGLPWGCAETLSAYACSGNSTPGAPAMPIASRLEQRVVAAVVEAQQAEAVAERVGKHGDAAVGGVG